MCQECGCSEVGSVTIDGKTFHKHSENHHHHHHGEGNSPDHNHDQVSKKKISITRDILDKNNHIAAHNREHLLSKGIFSMNWISAPGSGKTALLERIIKDYESDAFIVIEGDQQTDNDAIRIRNAGAKAIQINTGAACHLDAEMIHQALHQLELENTQFLVIENVGNMVCPTAYDLGESIKVAVISCPEGEDKPIKYPDLLITAEVLLINKIDLIPYLDFDLNKCIEFSKKVNPQIEIFSISAKTGEGVSDFYEWFVKKRQQQ